jgi:ZIP family zinc transporter
MAIGLLTGLATLLGGTLALRLRSSLDLLLGFGAGVVLGVALFDLMPEAVSLGGAGKALGALDIAGAIAIGFAAYLVLDQTAAALARSGAWRGHLGAAALTTHSLMDGLGIGLAFQVSPTVGAIVAFAVLAHDSLDGANTVTLVVSSGAGTGAARRWLLADAVAPLAGIGLSRLIVVPQTTLAVLLGVFGGFFLYIGASELLPRALNGRPRPSTTAAALLGLGVIYCVVRLAGG